MTTTCKKCKGKGWLAEGGYAAPHGGGDWLWIDYETITCPKCSGTGTCVSRSRAGLANRDTPAP